MANKLAQLQQLRALAVRTQAAIAAVAKAASDAITEVANSKADKDHTHTLPTASSTVLGVVKIGEGIENSGGVISSIFRSRGKPSNLNDATAPGWYAYAAGTANAPTGGAGIVQVVSVEGTVWPIQIAFPTAGTVIFIRTYDGTVWSAWTSVNSWRGIENSLTSDSTTDSLSAAMGKALKALVDGKAASKHTHSKSDVGLGNVDNTADSTKSVSYANSAGVAAQLGRGGDASVPMTFNWAGQDGQPSWVWGGNDGINMRVYDPSNFHVAYADSAGIASGFSGLPYTINFEGARAGTSVDVSELAPITYTFSKEYTAVGFIRATSYATANDRLKQLWDMIGATGFSENFIPMSALSTDFTPLSSIGNCAIFGMTKSDVNAGKIWLRKSGNSLQIYSHVNSRYNLDEAGYVYYYYGINFLPY